MKEDDTDREFRNVLQNLAQMTKLKGKKRWKAFLDKRSRLRLLAPNGKCYCPESAVAAFQKDPVKPPVVPADSYMDVEFVVAPKLKQDPKTAIKVAVSADTRCTSKPKAHVYQTCEVVYASRSWRRRLFLACGLDPKKA